MSSDNWDGDDDAGLPDAAFTKDELAAGVQYMARTGDPNATFTSSRTASSHISKPGDVGQNEYEDEPEARPRFRTFTQALMWAKENSGRSFSRATDGSGFEAKPERQAQGFGKSRKERQANIRSLAPHLSGVLEKSHSGPSGGVIRPLYRSMWEAELGPLTLAQLRRLRLLLTFELEANREYLRRLYTAMRRAPHMRRRDYGQDLFEGLQDIINGAIVDIDKRMAEQISVYEHERTATILD